MQRDQTAKSWSAVEAKLRADGAPERFIQAVGRRVEQVAVGELGTMPESTLQPLAMLPTIDETAAQIGRAALDRTVVIKLNGGLATNMGLDRPRSLLPVRGDQTFLDLVITQLKHLPIVPRLILFNSFATDEPTRRALEQRQIPLNPPLAKGEAPLFRKEGQGEILTVLQHRQPKLAADTLRPIRWPKDSTKEWCPPGHGDLYLTLETSGLLARLLDQGIEYAFVSNIDNLGATLDLAILGLVERERIPFLIEAARRTATDRKGGHLALADDHRLTLRELAQCPPDDHATFQDITRHRFFNTNSLWLHLPTVAALLATGDALTDLPLIINRKSVDPADPTSPAVLQLETAMGSAVGAVSGARAIHVPRQRFAPVKTTNELLIRRSDAYELTPAGELVLVRSRSQAPHVILGTAYKHLADFERRFPRGTPSLRDCDELVVDGDVTFGANVVVRGSVHLTGDQVIPDGTILEG